MKYEKLLHHKPWLRLVHIANITERLQRATRGNAFIVYNLIQQTYELHTIEAYELSGDSYNTSFDTELVNGFIIHDYKANDLKKFSEEVESERIYKNHLYDNQEKQRHNLDNMLKTIERTIGTKI
jgi:hypothetical protein